MKARAKSIDTVEGHPPSREAALRTVRRRILLDGAWKVFIREGLEKATMRSIATASGCTTGAIYSVFQSKEEIYAVLLNESLERLRDFISDAFGRAAKPGDRLMNAALAFLGYYRDRPNEVSLGLYLWHGIKPRGLGRALDAQLNSSLNQTFAILRASLQDIGFSESQTVDTELAALFSLLIGTLVVHQTGRLRLLRRSPEALVQLHIESVVARAK